MQNQKLQDWITEIKVLCEPDAVYVCNGSEEEYRSICKQLVDKKFFVPLNPNLRPGSYWCHSHPDDVARVEESTFICTKTKELAGPTNNWVEPEEMKKKLLGLFKGCMRGRTLYVIPFCMGPLGSKMSRIGIQITDSPYVVCSMYIMTRMGKKALDQLGKGDFTKCLHSVGVPLKPGEQDQVWPCDPSNRYIVHFPEEESVYSIGSGYGGNAILAKKSFALRIASVMGKKEGWFAEHMLIMGLENPKGKKIYIAAAFPSACGKTNLAMLRSALPGWKVTCVGDDIAWMHFESDGKLYAINPEHGIFGVAPGTSMKSNPYAMETVKKNSIFTNVALTDDGDVWWEEMTDIPPKHLTSWLGKSWDPSLKEKAAHPNSRFTAPLEQCPIHDPAYEDIKGVPISAILFGGRRSSLWPLAVESFSWDHGVFLAAGLSSETTAAAKGEVGVVRFDPFAMRPFCGYNMGSYFQHWIDLGKNRKNLPKIYYVNWFRKDEDGKYLWPGYGENIRVLQWIFDRVSGEGRAKETPLGNFPEMLFTEGLNVDLEKLFAIDKEGWQKELILLQRHFDQFGDSLPKEIKTELLKLASRFPSAAS